MGLNTQRQYNAYEATNTYKVSSFEKALIQLLAVSDSSNTAIIEENWGPIITRLSSMYMSYKADKTYGDEGIA